MGPYGNNINIPPSTSVDIAITIHNSCDKTISVKAALCLDRVKGSDQPWDYAKMSDEVDIEEGGDHTFHFDYTPNDDGTYYFKPFAYSIIARIPPWSYYVLTDQWEWSKGFEVSPTFIKDIWEPDNSFFHASYISTDGTHQTHNFEPAGDHDYLYFDAASGYDYTIETSNLAENSDTIVNHL